MIVYLIGGLIFGFGLAISGMTKPEVVLSFLQLNDFGLMLVMVGAIAVSFISFRIFPMIFKKPLTAEVWTKKDPEMSNDVWKGSAIFGVGWGICGLCPGAAIASLGVGNVPVLWGIFGMIIGAYIQGFLKSRKQA